MQSCVSKEMITGPLEVGVMSLEPNFETLRGSLLVWPPGAEGQRQAGSVSLTGREPSCLSERPPRLQFPSPIHSSADFTTAFRTRGSCLCGKEDSPKAWSVYMCVTCLWQALCQEARASLRVQRYVAPCVWPAVLQV